MLIGKSDEIKLGLLDVHSFEMTFSKNAFETFFCNIVVLCVSQLALCKFMSNNTFDT